MKHEPKLTDEEIAIWRAAYAAAFVADFERTWRRARERPMGESYPGAPTPLDVAMRAVTAEEALMVADAAIRRLREWRADNSTDEKAGLELGVWPKEWDPND